jgi:acetyltransferase-like isoleucine patch superfamily enzyme
MKKFIRKLKYYFYSFITRIVNNANSYTKAYNFDKAASFDNTASISAAANITNAQNDRSKIIIGKNTIIHGNLIVFGFGGEIEIGDNTFIGPNTNIWSAKKIKIGSYVLVSHNVNILDNISHPKNHIERMKDWDHIRTIGLREKNDYDLKEQEIIIEDNVWLGYNCSVNRGVTIGKGAIIGSNTIVTKDVPAFAILVGNPAKIIGYSD